MPDSRRVYKLAMWARVRRAVLAENPLCVRCLKAGLRIPATQVDHIIPIEDGGAWFDQENLQSLCASCHSKKTREDEGCTPREFAPGCDSGGNPIDQRHPWNQKED